MKQTNKTDYPSPIKVTLCQTYIPISLWRLSYLFCSLTAICLTSHVLSAWYSTLHSCDINFWYLASLIRLQWVNKYCITLRVFGIDCRYQQHIPGDKGKRASQQDFNTILITQTQQNDQFIYWTLQRDILMLVTYSYPSLTFPYLCLMTHCTNQWHISGTQLIAYHLHLHLHLLTAYASRSHLWQ